MATAIGTEGLGAIVQRRARRRHRGRDHDSHVGYVSRRDDSGILGQSPLAFLRGAKDAMLTAFTIRTSSGTLPVTIADAETNMRIDESVYGFGPPPRRNDQHGRAAIRQARDGRLRRKHGRRLVRAGRSGTRPATVILISIGTAGVPGAGLIMLTVILSAVGLPLEIVGFVAASTRSSAGSRRRTTTGDLAVASVVGADRWNRSLRGCLERWLEDGIPTNPSR